MTELEIIRIKAFLYDLEHYNASQIIVATALIAEINFNSNKGTISARKELNTTVATISTSDFKSFCTYWNVIGSIFCTNGFKCTQNTPHKKTLSGVLTIETLRNLKLNQFTQI